MNPLLVTLTLSIGVSLFAQAQNSQGSAAAGAQQALGLLYEEGRGGLPKDNAEAIRLYRKAAEQTAADLESSVQMTDQLGAMQKN